MIFGLVSEPMLLGGGGGRRGKAFSAEALLRGLALAAGGEVSRDDPACCVKKLPPRDDFGLELCTAKGRHENKLVHAVIFGSRCLDNDQLCY